VIGLIKQKQLSADKNGYVTYSLALLFCLLIFCTEVFAAFPPTLDNTATVTAPTGVVDSNTANNTATDSNSLLNTIDAQDDDFNTIDAQDDDFSASPIDSVAGGNTATVFTNDTLNSAAFANGVVTPSITNAGGLTGVTINADGTLTVPAGSTAGSESVK